MIDHENGRIIMPVALPACPPSVLYHQIDIANTSAIKRDRTDSINQETVIKTESRDDNVTDEVENRQIFNGRVNLTDNKNNCDDDDEYIEIEKLAEHPSGEERDNENENERNKSSDNETDTKDGNDRLNNIKKNAENRSPRARSASP